MKRLTVIILILLACTSISIAQTALKFKAYTFRYSYQLPDGTMSKATDFQATSILITVVGNRICFYSQEKQTYDVVLSEELLDKNGEEYMYYSCIDKDGKNCIVMYCPQPDGDPCGLSHIQICPGHM